MFLAADRQTITVRVAHAGCIVEFVHTGDYGSGSLAVRFDAGFAALMKNQGENKLGEPCDDKVLVRWHDGVVPQNTSLDMRTNVEMPAIQEPARWLTCTSELPTALAEARKTTSHDFSRFATQHVCLRGSKHEVAATDGRQLLRWGEFRFPWTEDLLIAGPPAFDAAELRSRSSWEVGRTEEQVVFRSGPWRIAASIEKEGRTLSECRFGYANVGQARHST
ncbi:MAG: hypothetical protein K2X38_09120 [Gemmataceae bacterium]|nr:hypothetical protein [Gemmataceae bacterium]